MSKWNPSPNSIGMMSGKTFKGTNPNKEGVQYGPLPHVDIPDPVDELLNKTNGTFEYQANGLVHIDPAKIEYLKS